MISPELQAQILRLHHSEGWPVGTIARQLRVHHETVERVLAQEGVPVAKPVRASMIEPYRAFIVETLTRYPTLRASRLYEMVRSRGYPGGPDHFRALVASLRPRPPAEAYLRLRTLPGDQAQADWAHFGRLPIGRALRPLMAFVMVLSYSRHLFLRFYLGASMGYFLRGHVEAFAYFGAIPRVILYDNLKSAVLERVAEAIRFNPRLLELAGHYRYEPRPVAPARGNEKGRVERAIRFCRDAFFAARPFRDLDDLNAQALAWCQGPAADRPCPEDRQRSVRAVFEQERAYLRGLPDAPFACDERLEVSVRKSPYVRFDWNDYSVPYQHVRRTLVVFATLDTVRIFDGTQLIATHPRSFDRGAQIESAAHVEELVAHKRAARIHRTQDRLHHGCPSAQPLFLRAAERGGHMGVLTRGLVALLDSHGAQALEAAIAAALANDAAHLAGVRHFIDLHAHAAGLPPPLAVCLPNDARLQGLSVAQPSLSDYDRLTQQEPDDNG
jgi:transposase